MNKITFVSHQEFPNDDFIKELVYLCIDDKYHLAFVRKKTKTGAMFWNIPTLGVNVEGQKKYFPIFAYDSSFLAKEIKDFLEQRKWENKQSFQCQTNQSNSPQIEQGDLPF